MEIVSSRQFKQQLDGILRTHNGGPIVVSDADQPVAVLLSPEEYQRLQNIEEAAYWIVQSRVA